MHMLWNLLLLILGFLFLPLRLLEVLTLKLLCVLGIELRDVFVC
jgi:hypothetical protein